VLGYVEHAGHDVDIVNTDIVARDVDNVNGFLSEERIMAEKAESYHHRDLRASLLDTVTKMIAERGVEYVTMRELAHRVGVSRSAPYRHFKDKSALLAAVAEEGFTRLADSLHAIYQDNAEDPLLCLQTMCVAYVMFAIENPTHYRLMYGEEVFKRADHPNVTAAASSVFSEVIKIVHQCRAANLLKPGSPAEIGQTAWALAHGLSLLWLDGLIIVKGDIKVQVEAAFQSLFVGIVQQDS
jgi:AcrR family transcriptional regulator